MREPKPWFRESDGWWYVTLSRRFSRPLQQRLIEGKRNREEAYRLFYELMADRPKEAPAGDRRVIVRYTAWDCVNLFLNHLEKETKKPRTFAWYKQFCVPFGRSLSDRLRATELKPFHVTEWMSTQTTWQSSGTKNAATRAIKRVFSWCEEQGYIDKNPLRGLKAPPKSRRETVVTLEEFEALKAKITDDQFRDLLDFVWNTGCRPQEVSIIQCHHVEMETRRIILELKNSKGQRMTRVIFMNDRAAEIISKWIQKRKSKGYVFRTRTGTPFNSNAINCRFRKLEEKVGKRYCLYHFRHSYTTDGLKKGIDPVTMAVLLGHSDPSTLAKVYQHVGVDAEYMAKQAGRAR